MRMNQTVVSSMAVSSFSVGEGERCVVVAGSAGSGGSLEGLGALADVVQEAA